MTALPPARILFVSANARRDVPLEVEREYNGMKEALRAHRGWAEEEHLPAAAWDQLPRYLRTFEPSIVHFAGHGYIDGGLEFTRDGQPQPVTKAGLVALFESRKKHVRLVVLNACYSDALARALTEHIDTVVGMPDIALDTRAIDLAQIFYEHLASGLSVQEAFDDTRTLLLGLPAGAGVGTAESPPPELLPQLHVRAGVDASQVRFSAARKRSPATTADAEAPLSGPGSCVADTRRLLLDLHLQRLNARAPHAVLIAAEVVKRALHRLLRTDPHATLEELIVELQRQGELELDLEVRRLLDRRNAAARVGQPRGDQDAAAWDEDGRAAAALAERLAVRARLITKAGVVECIRRAERDASRPTSQELFQLDRVTHRSAVERRLGSPARVLVFLIHGEIGQGHDHLANLVTWHLRRDHPAGAQDHEVTWPKQHLPVGARLSELLENLAIELGLVDFKVPPAADPSTPTGAEAWRPALDQILARIDERHERLFLRHRITQPTPGARGDAALVAAYVRTLWSAAAARGGQRIVVGLDLRRIEPPSLPFVGAWWASYAELRATRRISKLLDRLHERHRGIHTIPELTSVAMSDLVDWLRDYRGLDHEAAHREARQVIAVSRGGRFEQVIQQLEQMPVRLRAGERSTR